MTHRRPKKNKSNKKKKKPARVATTEQNVVNKPSISESPTELFLIEPPTFYISCQNDLIGDAELDFMSSEGELVEGIDVAIYPATDGIKQFFLQIMRYENIEVPQLANSNWIVVKLSDMQYMDAFIELDEAQLYVKDNFTNVKVFRLNTLGTKEFVDGEFGILPDFKSATKEEWIAFSLRAQDWYGYLFDVGDVIEVVLKTLVGEYHAEPGVLSDFIDETEFSSALSFAEKNGLHGVSVGIEVLQAFNEEFSVFRMD